MEWRTQNYIKKNLAAIFFFLANTEVHDLVIYLLLFVRLFTTLEHCGSSFSLDQTPATTWHSLLLAGVVFFPFHSIYSVETVDVVSIVLMYDCVTFSFIIVPLWQVRLWLWIHIFMFGTDQSFWEDAKKQDTITQNDN